MKWTSSRAVGTGLTVLFTLAGTAPAPAVAGGVVVGAQLALTGPYAWVGVPARDAMALGVEEINASGLLGDTKIQLVVEDTGSEKTQSITLVNRFAVRDKAVMVLGPSSSAEGVAIAPVANDLKIPLLAPTAVTEEITKSGPWAFKIPASPGVIIGEVAKYAVDKLGVKKVALVFGRDNEGQIGQKNAALAYFKSHGVEILAEESVLVSDTEFMALITKLIALRPDAIFLAQVAEQSANFIIQARQAGIDSRVWFLGVPNMGSERFLAVGGKAVEGSVFVADYFPGMKSAENDRFVSTFQARYKRPPDNWAALGYTAIKVAATAIKAAGANPTRDSVRQALTRIKDLPVVLGNGRFGFNEQRNPYYGAIVCTVKEGKFVVAR
jgi:branched-chain amino acid transport system substrate-binding protein